MLAWLAGAVIIFQMLAVFDTHTQPKDTVPLYYNSPNNYNGLSSSPNTLQFEPSYVIPKSVLKNKGVTKQRYDYSCGSAALTTILSAYLHYPIDEVQTINALLLFGNSEKIIQRRKFSLLDMKKMLAVIGFKSGGYRGQFKDLAALDHPAIIPINYGGFEHFVVLKKANASRVFIADPALGNLSMTTTQFQNAWKNNVVFIVFPRENDADSALALMKDSDLSYIDYDPIQQSAFQSPPFLHHFLERSADIAGQRFQYYRP